MSRPPAAAPGVAGLDVGGAATKAAWLGGAPPALRTASRAHEVWRSPERLEDVVREVVAAVAPAGVAALAVTTTAELSDRFRTKRDGVTAVLDAVAAAAGPVPLSVLTFAGELIGLGAARERPLDVAAANWAATARLVAGLFDAALVVDVGGTTTDVIPVAGGRIAARGRTDVDRLLAGELVYTGALRTNAATLAPAVPLRGSWCPVAAELFATSADVHLLTGALTPGACTAPTADGRPVTLAHARERLARVVCGDTELLAEDDVHAIAAFLAEAQVERIASALTRAATILPAGAPVVALGAGAFLACAAAERAGLPVAATPPPFAAGGAEVAPAAALARLLADAR